MAAPSGTVWGSIVTGSGGQNYQKGKIGIYTSISSTDTITSVNVQVWFATPYSCSDSSNNVYFDIGAGVTSASTLRGSASIYHTVDTGSGWNESNQTKIWSKTYDYRRTTNNQNCNIHAKFNGIDIISGGTMYANKSVTIPALTSYTVSYNASGGSGAPSSQTKYYGQNLTLSSTKPTRTGYSFQGWATSSGGSVSYSAGASYTNNASVTLYAVWKANTYTVSYDANGGSGAPSSQTKTYGQTLTLSTTIPKKTNYNFKGWGLSASTTTVSYGPGGSYTNNAAVTLYAIWELAYIPPLITGLKASRCDSDGTLNDFGKYAKIQFSWECCQLTGTNNVSSIVIYYKSSSSTDWTDSVTVDTGGGYAGTVRNKVIGGSFDLDAVYNVKVVVIDSLGGKTPAETNVSTAKFIIDFLSGGGGVAFGKPASKQDAAEFNFDIFADKNIYDKYGTGLGNGRAEYTGSGSSAINPDTTLDHCIITDKNTPNADSNGYGSFFYIITYFYGDKTVDGNKTQIAVPYDTASSNKGIYYRYKNSGAWSGWVSNALQAYPVNSIYISYSHTSPAELFGGTWTRIESRFLWGCSSSETIGKTAGAKTHTLTVDEMPSHRHGAHNLNTTGYTTENLPFTAGGSKKGYSGNLYTLYSGGGAAHNNMPPYIQVSIWRRTA